jgi:hypothetical protein
MGVPMNETNRSNDINDTKEIKDVKPQRSILLAGVVSAMVLALLMLSCCAFAVQGGFSETADKAPFAPCAPRSAVEIATEKLLQDNPGAVRNADGTVTLVDGTVIDPADPESVSGVAVKLQADKKQDKPAKIDDDKDKDAKKDDKRDNDADEPTPPLSDGSSEGTQPPPSDGNKQGTWHDGWEERVWVDTSHSERRLVSEARDEEIWDQRTFCRGCGADITENVMQHMDWHLEKEGRSYGWYDEHVLRTVHHDAVYQDVWVEEGHWNIVWHEGYWTYAAVAGASTVGMSAALVGFKRRKL